MINTHNALMGSQPNQSQSSTLQHSTAGHNVASTTPSTESESVLNSIIEINTPTLPRTQLSAPSPIATTAATTVALPTPAETQTQNRIALQSQFSVQQPANFDAPSLSEFVEQMFEAVHILMMELQPMHLSDEDESESGDTASLSDFSELSELEVYQSSEQL
jgi:hypothetical protein